MAAAGQLNAAVRTASTSESGGSAIDSVTVPLRSVEKTLGTALAQDSDPRHRSRSTVTTVRAVMNSTSPFGVSHAQARVRRMHRPSNRYL